MQPLPPPYERPPRRALADLPAEARAAWRTRYLNDDGAEMRVLGLLDRMEAALRFRG